MLVELLKAQSRVRQALLLAGAGSATYYAYKRFSTNKQQDKEEAELKKRCARANTRAMATAGGGESWVARMCPRRDCERGHVLCDMNQMQPNIEEQSKRLTG